MKLKKQKRKSKVKELNVNLNNSIADLKGEVMEIKKMFLKAMAAAKLHHHSPWPKDAMPE